MTLEEHLETEFRRYYPTLTDFEVGANDEDCLTVVFLVNGQEHEYWQTEENMGSSDADWFVFSNMTTGIAVNNILTIPIYEETE